MNAGVSAPSERISLVFVTGNPSKLAEARKVAEQYGINLQSRALEITEVQSHNPLVVSQAKAKSAYQILKRPIITHDSSWSIPAINGFPGAYMHDVVDWFAPEDWLNLVRGHHMRTIEVCENITYYDGQKMKCFQYRQEGVFVDTPRGTNGNSLEKVVMFADDKTIAEHHDANLNNNSVVLSAWEDFFNWYCKDCKKYNAK